MSPARRLPGDNTVLASGERGDPTIEGGITVRIPHFTPLAATRVPFSLHTSENPPTMSCAPPRLARFHGAAPERDAVQLSPTSPTCQR